MIWAITNMSSPTVALMMPMDTTWTLSEAGAVWLMWAVMMMAMMLPSALPMIASHAGLAAQRDPQTPDASLWFLMAYLLAWTLFSLAASGLQWAFQRADLLSHMLKLENPLISTGIVMVAGVFQLTPRKAACLQKCRTPTDHLMMIWHPGRGGAVRMGLHHGLHCVACCWALMTLLFVGGVMDLAAITVLTVVVALEKLTPKGPQIAKLTGAALLVWGSLRLLGILGAMTP
jgi:predicted metal-binding membrane protein